MARPGFLRRITGQSFAWAWNKWLNKGVTGYHQSGGSGDRLTKITVTYAGLCTAWENALNGMLDAVAGFTAGSVTSGSWVAFDFRRDGGKKVITGFKITMSANGTQGVWQWQGSNNGSSYTNIGSTITLGSAGSNVTEYNIANTTQYDYYRLLGVSGTTTVNPKVSEIEFKIAA